MPTSHTKLTVWNLALDLIDEVPIQALPGTGKAARFLARWWDHVRQTELQANVWNFAIGERELAEDATYDATSRWGYRYVRPNGALRVLPPAAGNVRYGRPIDHQMTKDGLLTNTAGPLGTWWVFDVTNPGEWDPLFAQVIVASLGVAMANKFTGKSSYVDRAMQMRADALDKAMEINAIEGSMEPIEQHDILRARGLGLHNPTTSDEPIRMADWL